MEMLARQLGSSLAFHRSFPPMNWVQLSLRPPLQLSLRTSVALTWPGIPDVDPDNQQRVETQLDTSSSAIAEYMHA
eukprot:2966936-Pyramimonas_sp.AAC.1